MPHGNKTGPHGQGMMTGRKAGYCNGFSVPGYANPGRGRGMFMRRGFSNGRGFGRGWWPVQQVQPQYTREDELAMLKNESQYMEDAMNRLKERIDELEAESKQQV